MHLDTGLRTLFGRPQVTERPNPANDIAEAEQTEAEKALAAISASPGIDSASRFYRILNI